METAIDPLIARLPEAVRGAVSEAARDGTWIKVRRALAAFEKCSPEIQGPETPIQVLASFEVPSIEPALRLGLHCIPCRPKLRIAPLNTIEQELLNSGSPVYAEKNSATVVLWRVDELMPEVLHPSWSGKDFSRRGEIETRVTKMVEFCSENSPVPLFLGTLPLPMSGGRSLLGFRPNPVAAEAIAWFNTLIFGLGRKHARVHVLDVNWWAAYEGGAHYDLQMDFVAKQPFTVKAAISLGLFLARKLRPLLVPRHKVLVVDLDNTLWGGILEEDGIGQLSLGHDSPGNVFLQIQKEILELKKQGILLVLASKNEESAVRKAFEQVPNMLVKWEDFSSRKIDFEHKYSNLRAVATELGLGLDSFVFLDDSDFEREQMRMFNPEVRVVNQSANALEMLASLKSIEVFDTHKITNEDLQRSRDYELRSARSQPQADNLEEFLTSLQLRAILEPIDEINLDRAVQMLGKTNQFNVTTRRHQVSDLKTMISRPGTVSLALRLVDKFGDQGIVALLLAIPGPGSESLEVDSFLLSCRALGRGAEAVLWAELTTTAAKRGIRSLGALYLPTPKNQMVADLFDRLGMTRVGEAKDGVGYILSPIAPAPIPAWIAVERNRL